MRLNVVIRYICTALLLMSLFELASAGVAYYYGKDSSMVPLLISAFITFIMGIFPRIFVRPVKKLTMKEIHFIVLGSWIAVCLMGTLPYIMWERLSIVDCIFECVSGFTTTGATIIGDLTVFPKGLLFWRICTAWIGGVGIIIFTILLVPSMGRLVANATRTDAISGQSSTMNTRAVIKSVIIVYLIITIATTIALKLAGMNWYDALYHSMSCASTCGFGTRNNSLAFYDSAWIEGILIVSMLFAGTNFSVIYASIFGKKGGLRQSETFKYYFISFLVCASIILVVLQIHNYELGYSIRSSLFHTISLLTTTGFAITDTNVWPSICIIILMICSVVCACSGSTSGGIKMDRFLVGMKGLGRYISNYRNPEQISAVRFERRTVDSNSLYKTYCFIILYLLTLVVGTILLNAFGMESNSAFTAAIATLGNVGPGFGDVGSMNNYTSLSDMAKVVATILMLLGRLEILGVVGLFAVPKHKRHHKKVEAFN